jgi:hypothetical protein
MIHRKNSIHFCLPFHTIRYFSRRKTADSHNRTLVIYPPMAERRGACHQSAKSLPRTPIPSPLVGGRLSCLRLRQNRRANAVACSKLDFIGQQFYDASYTTLLPHCKLQVTICTGESGPCTLMTSVVSWRSTSVESSMTSL